MLTLKVVSAPAPDDAVSVNVAEVGVMEKVTVMPLQLQFANQLLHQSHDIAASLKFLPPLN